MESRYRSAPIEADETFVEEWLRRDLQRQHADALKAELPEQLLALLPSR